MRRGKARFSLICAYKASQDMGSCSALALTWLPLVTTSGVSCPRGLLWSSNSAAPLLSEPGMCQSSSAEEALGDSKQQRTMSCIRCKQTMTLRSMETALLPTIRGKVPR